MKRRAAVEPVIGHIKNGHRMDRNYLAGTQGDAINAILPPLAYNFRLPATWLRLILRRSLLVLFGRVRPQSALKSRIVHGDENIPTPDPLLGPTKRRLRRGCSGGVETDPRWSAKDPPGRVRDGGSPRVGGWLRIGPGLGYLTATNTAPAEMSPTPSQLGRDSSSPRNRTPNSATSTTLSLSMGATCAALPILSARK